MAFGRDDFVVGKKKKMEWISVSPTKDEEQKTDRMLSEQLLKLSFEERNNISEEMHGVRTHFPESKEAPEAQEQSLLELDREVRSLVLDFDSNLGIENIPTNRSLRLAFLRCEFYDAKTAAHRLCMYVRFIREHSAHGGGGNTIGDGKAGERLVASEWFTRDEYSAFKKGVIQLMPYRDRRGRRVMVVLSACFKLEIITRCKIMLYLIQAASEDVESQKNGFVILLWPGSCESLSPSYIGFFARLSERQIAINLQSAFPLRMSCIHLGNSRSPLMRLAKVAVVALAQSKNRTRFNFVTGTEMEINYKIMGFGIHPTMLPVTKNGSIKTRNHIQWLESRQRIENDPYGSVRNSPSGGAIVECPGIMDVLFNRGKNTDHHPGNETFRGILESKKGQHLSAHQTMKWQIAWEIVEEVEDRKGRFFYWDNQSGWWVEFSTRTDIRHKVATSLRDFHKRARAIENRQHTHSSTHVFRNQEARKRKRDDPDSDNSSCDCNCFSLKQDS